MSSDSTPNAILIPLEDAEQAAACFGSLRAGNPVLRSALRLLRGEPIESIQPLHSSLKDPNPKRWKERIAAAWTLGRSPLTSEDSDAASGTLMNVLENVFRERGRTKMPRWVFRTALPALTIGVIAATAIVFWPPALLPLWSLLAPYCAFHRCRNWRISPAIFNSVPVSFRKATERPSASRRGQRISPSGTR